MKKAIGYVRVSTTKQEFGPAAQRRALQAWCVEQGYELVEVFSDIGVSGAAEPDRRHGLMRALTAVRHNRAAILLVAKRDRLSRDVRIAELLDHTVRKLSAQIVSVDGVGNDQSPYGIFNRQIMDAVGQLERALIIGRVRAGMAEAKRQGRTLGQIPYGYELGPDGQHLQPRADEQAVIAQIRAWRKESLSYRKIQARLNALGIPARPKNGTTARAGQWHYASVRRVCLNNAQAQEA